MLLFIKQQNYDIEKIRTAAPDDLRAVKLLPRLPQDEERPALIRTFALRRGTRRAHAPAKAAAKLSFTLNGDYHTIFFFLSSFFGAKK